MGGGSGDDDEDEDARKMNVCICCVESSGTRDLQRCLIPAPLLLGIGGRAGGHLRLQLTPTASLVCRVAPVVGLCVDFGYQVVACGCVSEMAEEVSGCGGEMDSVSGQVREVSESTSGCGGEVVSEHGREVSGNESKVLGRSREVSGTVSGVYRVTPKQITLLSVVVPSAVEVVVVMRGVAEVLAYRRNKNAFCAALHSLLALYAVTPNAVVQCRKNPLAKLLGVTIVEVRECQGIGEEQVGTVGKGTSVVVHAVESEERRKMMVRRGVQLGGLDHILSHLRRLVVEPWTRREEFRCAGVLYPSGVLLVGPPGCGKTSLVRQLCVETGASLVATAGAELASPYEGETERNFASVAERAMALAEEGPCVFFVDEIDSLCRARTPDAPLRTIRLTAQVLLTLDKCRECPTLTLLAATNRPFDLDLALRRSGRLEIEVLLNAPSEAERCSILAVHTRSLLPQCTPDLARVAHLTPGFVGADLQALTLATAHTLQSRQESPSPEEVTETMVRVAASLTPSLHKTLGFVTARPSLAPIAGLEHTSQELHQIFTHHLKYAQLYEQLRLKRPKGVLLYGPRGCGKTRLAASLASSQGCTFITATAAHLLSPYVGESEKRVAALFHAARLAQPSIVFIDEIDGIFGSREVRGGGVGVSLLNELLQALDGAEVNATSLQGASLLAHTTYTTASTSQGGGVLVLAATNNPAALDPALLRPGRFDRLVYVPPPDAKARLDILKLKTQGMEVSDEGVLEQLATDTEGFTGAELENLVLKALVCALREGEMREGRVMVGTSHLWAARHAFTPSLTAQEMKVFHDFKKTVSGS